MTAPSEPAIAPIRAGFHTITPSLIVGDAASAIDFYQRAFGATEISRASAPDGNKIMHALISIGDSKLMLNDEFPEYGARGPLTIGGTSVTLHLYVEDADATFAQAVAAGATPTMPMSDVFWGDRFGQVRDPYGHLWGIATAQRDVTDADVKMLADEWGACADGAPASP